MVLADTFARAVGLTALAFGFVGTVVSVLTYLRDRPHLSLTWSFQMHVEKGHHLIASVVNDGRQLIAISDVAVRNFRWKRPRKWVLRGRFYLATFLWHLGRLTRWRVSVISRWVEHLSGSKEEDKEEVVVFGSGIGAVDQLTEPRVLRPGEALEMRFALERLVGLEPGEGGSLWVVATDALGRSTSHEVDPEAVSQIREIPGLIAEFGDSE